MSDPILDQIEALIQEDVNARGLARDLEDNLITRCRGDFAAACQELAATKEGHTAIITGFWIPAAGAAETDGPLGAVLLGQVLATLGWRVELLAEPFCSEVMRLALSKDPSLTVGAQIAVHDLTADTEPPANLTHLIAIERVGPNHAHEDIPPANRDQCHTMRGYIITDKMTSVHRWFESSENLSKGRKPPEYSTIGIGDGGNEIGMGKAPRHVIAKNVYNGGLIACRIATHHNIVCGISNWGAFGFAAGVWHLSGRSFDSRLFDIERDRQVWQRVIEQTVLVDGVTGRRELTVDGLSWEDYARPLHRIVDLLKSKG